MSDDVVIPEETPEQSWRLGWLPVDFRPATSGSASVRVDGVERATWQMVGWLIEEAVGVEATTGRAHHPASGSVRRVTPAFLSGQGTVVSLESLTRSVAAGTRAERFDWTVRVGGEDAAAVNVTVPVTVQPAEVVVMPEPATRRVIRDQYGQIDKVVAE